LAIIAADPPAEKAERKSNPIIPSLPLLTDKEEDALDEIIDRFIAFDSGQSTGAGAKKAKEDFDRLDKTATMALVRGMNKSALIEHSCPAVTIARKLSKIAKASDDKDLLDFIRENAGSGVEKSRHLGVIKDLRVLCAIRKAEIARGILVGENNSSEGHSSGSVTRITPKGNSLKSKTTKELAEMLNKEEGNKLQQVIRELGQRKGDDPMDALAIAANSYDKDAAKLARDQLVRCLGRLTDSEVVSKLKNAKPAVRLAIVQHIAEKKLRWGGELIRLLEDKDLQVREAAQKELVRLNGGKDLGPNADATAKEWEEAIVKWKAWWEKEGKK
jgi:hypothetical protein